MLIFLCDISLNSLFYESEKVKFYYLWISFFAYLSYDFNTQKILLEFSKRILKEEKLFKRIMKNPTQLPVQFKYFVFWMHSSGIMAVAAAVKVFNEVTKKNEYLRKKIVGNKKKIKCWNFFHIFTRQLLHSWSKSN